MRLVQTLSIAIASALGVVAALPSQSSMQLQGGQMHAVVVAGDHQRLLLDPGIQVAVSDSVAELHFPTNAHGKPLSLKLAIPTNTCVDIGVASALPARAQKLQLFAAGGSDSTLMAKTYAMPIHVHTMGLVDAELSDYRVSISVETVVDARMFGIVARHRESSGCYLFSADWQAQVLRLERWMGADHSVIGKVDAPWLLPQHRLTLQVDGFRLQCLVDDEVVLQCLDGALGNGAPGVAWVGNRPKVGDLMIESVAHPLASAALVQGQQRAKLYSSVPFAPGHLYMLELSLDRPHPWVPRSAAGFELSLMQPLAAPVILWADWRASFGRDTVGEVGLNGSVTCGIELPDLLTLRANVALARILIVAPNGSAVVGVTPSVRVCF